MNDTNDDDDTSEAGHDGNEADVAPSAAMLAAIRSLVLEANRQPQPAAAKPSGRGRKP